MALTEWKLGETNFRSDTAESEAEPDSPRPWRQALRKFRRHKLAAAGSVVTLLLIAAALLAPAIVPYDPKEVTGVFSAAPSAEHWLGTDQVGRDVFSRLVYATRVSLIVGFASVFLYVTFGTLVGLVSGYFGGWLDMAIMRITDMFMAFPFLMVILVVVAVLGSDMRTIILVLALFSWPGVARLVRGSVLTIKRLDYVRAGIALGYGTPRILLQHVLPNAAGPVIVQATFGVASAIMSEAGLSFLGMGVQPPTASWGNMLTDAQSLTVLTEQPWLWIPPGAMILLVVLSINFVGDGLRDALDSQP
ncbi:ABC transporter permease [Paenibacillus chitinolyticus]|uniref:ABC transporter permease n=1 Tax=Paenibacillus chitinolyticus TaxID=79263 RepID=A0A410WXN5_9BACL|nr:oligopeptide ABC transporter permease [Paenibacillus chitinolyticus]MCY9589627.1 ABC transporter permease [Paenibacillus chitinolyticus]MCY9598372.1 ABC transporter permease [Paenibacillus chitinolyticus]QAV19011.1 ABC transporter permease [Paenibacillus chitinolyticus]